MSLPLPDCDCGKPATHRECYSDLYPRKAYYFYCDECFLQFGAVVLWGPVEEWPSASEALIEEGRQIENVDQEHDQN